MSGLLLVRMKSGEALAQPIAPLPSMLMFAPFGFKQETEFYSPKYETAQQKNDPVPDLRTTLYWNPETMRRVPSLFTPETGLPYMT